LRQGQVRMRHWRLVSGFSEGAGGGAGGMSGGDGQGQSGHMKMPIGVFLAEGVTPTRRWRGQRTDNASTCPSGVGLPCCTFTVLFG
jgi:hypothetical protein